MRSLGRGDYDIIYYIVHYNMYILNVLDSSCLCAECKVPVHDTSHTVASIFYNML